MLHPRCMQGDGQVRLSCGHEGRGAGGVQHTLAWTDLPKLKVETQNLVKSYMQDHELHTRDHARGELRLRSEARPAQLT